MESTLTLIFSYLYTSAGYYVSGVNKPHFVNKMDILLLAMGYQNIYQAMIYDAHKQSN